jgi:hypothetical protein
MRRRGVETGACAFGYDGCYQKHGQGVKIPRKMSDEEAAKVVLPVLGKVYHTSNGFTNEARFAKRDQHGRPIVASDGTGRLKEPVGGEYIEGDPVKRYLESVGAPGCCTEEEPCDRHRGALRGRDWKTGEYL